MCRVIIDLTEPELDLLTEALRDNRDACSYVSWQEQVDILDVLISRFEKAWADAQEVENQLSNGDNQTATASAAAILATTERAKAVLDKIKQIAS